jgi:hypothetical protein
VGSRRLTPAARLPGLVMVQSLKSENIHDHYRNFTVFLSPVAWFQSLVFGQNLKKKNE